MKNKMKRIASSVVLLFLTVVFAAGEDKGGECVFSIVGLQKPGELPTQHSGMKIMADLAHRYGHPVTWYLKPDLAEYAKEDLQEWHQKYGD